MAVFIVVILGVYCLRHQAAASRARRAAIAAQVAEAALLCGGETQTDSTGPGEGGDGGARPIGECKCGAGNSVSSGSEKSGL